MPRAKTPEFIHFLNREAEGPKWRILTSSLTAGLSRGLLLSTISAAITKTAPGYLPWPQLFGFIGALILHLGSSYYAQTRSRMLVTDMAKRLRLRLIDKLLFTQLHFIETRGDSDIYTNLTADINRLSGAVLTLIPMIQGGILLLFCLGYIGWISPVALGITVLTLIAGVTSYMVQEKAATANTRNVRRREVEFFSAISDILHGFKELKINRAKNNAIDEHVNDISETHRDLVVQTEQMFTVSQVSSQSFMFILMAILVFVVPMLYTTSTNEAFQFLAALLFAVGPLESIVTAIPGLIRARVAMENVIGLDRALDNSIAQEENRAREIAPLQMDEVILHQVGFTFSGQQSDDAFALGPLDLAIKRGEILFIVGGNGSGKTTLGKILTGLYLPTTGELNVNGKPLTLHDYQAYREMFATVFNDFHLFHRLYGIEHIDLALLNELLDRLDIHSKTHYENGAFTAINLSTGQRKRLAYTGAYLEEKQIYVFDEFAADQDPHFRRLFYRELLPELKARGKTVVAVTHDDQYFGACDRLVKLDYGHIVYDGPPEAGH